MEKLTTDQPLGIMQNCLNLFYDRDGEAWVRDTNDRIYMEDWSNGDNHLSHNWKPLAWRRRPEPYNPYLPRSCITRTG